MARKAQGPGRPKVHAEAWTKVSVVLFARQIAHLDRLTRKARRRGHKGVTRAFLIRAVIDGVLASGLDLCAHASEAALREDVARRLKGMSREL
jgi:hypothetical protein